MRRFRLTRALVLEAPLVSPDGAGGHRADWQELGRIWAELRPGPGRERLREPGSSAEMIYRAYTHAAPEDDPRRPRAGQRFREGARRFAILAVGEADAGGQWLICLLREEVPV